MPAPLSVVTEQLPKSQVGMTIEVPAEVVDATYERVLNRLVSRAKIEGFRPGRAPRALVEARRRDLRHPQTFRQVRNVRRHVHPLLALCRSEDRVEDRLRFECVAESRARRLARLQPWMKSAT